MDIRNKKHERGSNWTDPEIVELLQLWSDDTVQLELESSLRNQRVFDRIARALQERGIFRTGDQCREKIKKMRLEYRRIKDNHKTRSWKFFDVIDRVLSSRPSITYSSMGGTVIAQHVYQNQGGAEGFQTTVPASPFGPAASGGFLFGHPLKPDDAHGIKCENVDESMLNSSVPPPEMYYGSEEDHETDVQSVMGQEEEATGQEETAAAAPNISPSGFSDVNTSCSAATGPLAESVSHERLFAQAAYPVSGLRHRKRKTAGKASHKAGSGANHSGLDRALVGFLKWQQAAEERLLALEEARAERELLAEERREQREERRAEQEREHELRLFSMLTGTLVAARREAQAPEPGMTSNALSEASFLSHLPASEDMLSYARGHKTPVKPCGGLASKEHSPYLSGRGNSIRQHKGILQEGFLQYGVDKYHETENPSVSALNSLHILSQDKIRLYLTMKKCAC